MRRRLAITALAVVLGVGGAMVYYRITHAVDILQVTTAPVNCGDVVEVVDATGTLEAVTTVQVGTQVSGTIKALYADFNTVVRRGQVIARLEPSLFETQVAQARASLVRLEAEAARTAVQWEDAQRKLARARDLYAQQLIPLVDLETAEIAAREAEAAVGAAQAQIAQARASLNQSEVNLAHTVITAPIDGIVISRNVDVGQTVAASMQAPTLFVIARDLSEMRVNASVAESDIGRAQQGQLVSFIVDAYPGRQFAGRVVQVRLQPVVEQNVVSYLTTIDVRNPDLELKPGMTANVTIEVARETNVLRVPNGALRLRLPDDAIAALGAQPVTREKPVSSVGRAAEVWISVNGRLERVPLRVGLTNGSYAAVLAGALAEGDLVGTALRTAADSTPSAGTSPLLPVRPARPGGRTRDSARPPATPR